VTVDPNPRILCCRRLTPGGTLTRFDGAAAERIFGFDPSLDDHDCLR